MTAIIWKTVGTSDKFILVFCFIFCMFYGVFTLLSCHWCVCKIKREMERMYDVPGVFPLVFLSCHLGKYEMNVNIVPG